MANIAVDRINEKITELQDKKRVAAAAFHAQAEAHAQAVAALDQELNDWAEVLDRYHGTQEPAKKPAAKKATAPKK